MRRKKILIGIGLLLLIIGILYGQWWSTRMGQKDFKNFNTNLVSGEISFVGTWQHGAGFKLKGENIVHVFYPYIDKSLNNNHIFTSFASVGDSVFKPAYSDTLYLIKSGKIFKYTFQKNNGK